MKKLLPILMLPALALVLLPSVASAGDAVQRKIAVMEKILDTTLIESKHALVFTGGVADGVYLEGYGVLFKIEFEFVEKSNRKLLDHIEDIDSLRVYWREMIGAGDDGDGPMATHRRELLNQIEDELIDAILEYGGTLSGMGKGEMVSIVAFPWYETWDVTPEPVRALTIRARFDDLRAYTEDRLDDEQIRERIMIDETR